LVGRRLEEFWVFVESMGKINSGSVSRLGAREEGGDAGKVGRGEGLLIGSGLPPAVSLD